MTNKEYRQRIVEYLAGTPSRDVLEVIALMVDQTCEQNLQWVSQDGYEILHHAVFGPGWRIEIDHPEDKYAQMTDFQEQYESYDIQPDGPLGDMVPPPF